jgi:hypothetical protein
LASVAIELLGHVGVVGLVALARANVARLTASLFLGK